MTIDELIKQLGKAKQKVGGDATVAAVGMFGENDYNLPEYVVTGDFRDQDGYDYKVALIANRGGEEFTQNGIAHYKWNPETQKV